MRSLAIALFTLCALSAAAHADSAESIASESIASEAIASEANAGAPLEIDIPAQPLEDALYAFGTATGVEVFTDGKLVAGRRSTAVKGAFTVLQALHELLVGTGLQADAVGPRAFALAARGSNDRQYQHYSASLQQAALQQLCGETSPDLGSYRIAMQIWLDERGHPERLELLSSTGDPSRDQTIHDRLMRMRAGGPPASLPQPVVMVILPRAMRDTGDCRPAPSTGGGQARP